MRIKPFRFKGDAAEDIRRKYGDEGDLARLFAGNTGRAVQKWHHYIPIYDRHLARFRGGPVRFLEIGVKGGGSLEMWRRYLGEAAVIAGIDIDTNCAALDGDAAMVRIGSQDDPAFLDRVVEEMGGVDVVLDDGSHQMAHVRASLAHLFPRLATRGVYLIEDLHTAYWETHGGGLHAPGNLFNEVREIIDDMHRWYHDAPREGRALGALVSGLHVYDSLVVLDKDPVHPPVHSRQGTA